MLHHGPQICQNLDEALPYEWIETNGLGGFSSSTIVGLNTRRYHGLLTAATQPPVGRLLLLSKLEETLIVDGQRFELSANQYPGVIHPQGFRYLMDFRLDPFPVFTYHCAGVQLEKRVFMIHGENSTVVEYQLLNNAGADCGLELKPLIAFRDYHSTTHENADLNPAVALRPALVSFKPYANLPTLHLAHTATSIDERGEWYRSFEFREEESRGLDFREDLFNPCTLSFDLNAANTAALIASTEIRSASGAAMYRQQEVKRRAAFDTALTRAADQFIVDRGDWKTIVAGYHWFSDWGRDTMIALPGLTLSTGRHAIAQQILLAFANSIDQGMLPNRFPDAGEAPEYNTVDATLWFFEAVRAYLDATNDQAFVMTHLFPKLADIVDWHIRGTRYNIRVDSDGLIGCGQPGVQLTWMDAKVGDWVVTPRQGKPVEIQALWYNALCIMHSLSGDSRFRTMADQARVSFNQQFWNDDAQCLYDVIDGVSKDAAIRPNQIFAVSLPHSMLDAARARAVVDKVQAELLTPMGLRTLAASDPNYHGKYQGGVRDRDAAYHQGTVWPWLIGPFLHAYLKVHPEGRAQAQAWLAPLLGFVETHGQLPEIADGDFPHDPRGCIAQAWSVAEVLRASTGT